MPKEPTLMSTEARFKAVRRAEGLIAELDRLQQLKLADLKTLRHERAELEARRHEIITDDTGELFPGADLREPESLADRGASWTLLNEKDLWLCIYRVERTGAPPFYIYHFHLIQPGRPTTDKIGKGGSMKENAIAAGVEDIRQYLRGDNDRAPRKRDRALYDMLDALMQKAKPLVPAIDPLRVMPAYGAWTFFGPQGEMLLNLPSTLLPLDDQCHAPVIFHAADGDTRFGPERLFACVTPAECAEDSAFAYSTALSVCPRESWAGAIANSQDEAFDGHLMGVAFRGADGHDYVCEAWNSAFRIVSVACDEATQYLDVYGEHLGMAGLRLAWGKAVAAPLPEDRSVLPGLVMRRKQDRDIPSASLGPPAWLLIGPQPGLPPWAFGALPLFTRDEFETRFPLFRPSKDNALSGWPLKMPAGFDNLPDKLIGAPMSKMRAIRVHEVSQHLEGPKVKRSRAKGGAKPVEKAVEPGA